MSLTINETPTANAHTLHPHTHTPTIEDVLRDLKMAIDCAVAKGEEEEVKNGEDKDRLLLESHLGEFVSYSTTENGRVMTVVCKSATLKIFSMPTETSRYFEMAMAHEVMNAEGKVLFSPKVLYHGMRSDIRSLVCSQMGHTKEIRALADLVLVIQRSERHGVILFAGGSLTSMMTFFDDWRRHVISTDSFEQAVAYLNCFRSTVFIVVHSLMMAERARYPVVFGGITPTSVCISGRVDFNAKVVPKVLAVELPGYTGLEIAIPENFDVLCSRVDHAQVVGKKDLLYKHTPLDKAHGLGEDRLSSALKEAFSFLNLCHLWISDAHRWSRAKGGKSAVLIALTDKDFLGLVAQVIPQAFLGRGFGTTDFHKFNNNSNTAHELGNTSLLCEGRVSSFGKYFTEEHCSHRGDSSIPPIPVRHILTNSAFANPKMRSYLRRETGSLDDFAEGHFECVVDDEKLLQASRDSPGQLEFNYATSGEFFGAAVTHPFFFPLLGRTEEVARNYREYSLVRHPREAVKVVFDSRRRGEEREGAIPQIMKREPLHRPSPIPLRYDGVRFSPAAGYTPATNRRNRSRSPSPQRSRTRPDTGGYRKGHRTPPPRHQRGTQGGCEDSVVAGKCSSNVSIHPNDQEIVELD